MVERWRQETLFIYAAERRRSRCRMLPFLGLRVHGPAITGTTHIIWLDLYEELFGIIPPEAMLSGSSLRLQWLRHTFQHLPDEADDETVQLHA